jgi:hypothetical protein
MTTEAEYEVALRAAERELSQAASAEDVRSVWRKHFGTVGHRALGRLLLGRSAAEQLERRAERGEAE